MRLKRILFYLIRYPGYGGIESVTTLIVNKLIEYGYEVSILSYLHENEDSLLPLVSKKIHLYYMPDGVNWHNTFNVSFLEELFLKNRYDLAIHQDSYADTHAVLYRIVKLYGCPVFTFEHSSPLAHKIDFKNYVLKPRRYDFKWLLHVLLYPYFVGEIYKKQQSRREFIYSHCQKYILLSKNYIPEFKHFLPLDHYDKLAVIHNPIKEAEIEVEYSSKENVVLFVGRLEPVKNVKALLSIWEGLYKKYRDWKFVIVGEGSESGYLKDFVRKRHIKNVFFEGYRDPDRYYQKAKIFVMASLYEGWPMTLVESMQYGTVPVAYQSFASITDIVEHEKNGFLIPVKCPELFRKKLEELFLDAKQLEFISQNAKESIKKFGTETIIKDWLNLFEDIS